MEKNSAYLEFLKYREGNKTMSDVALARTLLQDIGGAGRTSAMLYSAATTLRKLFPHKEEPHKQWSERRLKGWWYGENENVLHREMVELYQAAKLKKAEQELIREARNEHRTFLAKTAAIAALLERQDPDFFGPQIEALGQQSSRVGGTRNQGD